MTKLVMALFLISGAKDVKDVTAFEVDCPAFTIIAAPADGQATLARVHGLAECLGNQGQVCTLQVIKVRRQAR